MVEEILDPALVPSQPASDFLAIPEVSSENRKYVPIAFLTKDVIATNKLYTVEGANRYHFGVLASAMHNAWIRFVAGRLKSDFQYSAGIVYNNLPWPKSPTAKQVEAVEKAAQTVLDARASFSGSSLADLYDPLSMPQSLLKAHEALDRAVDQAYGRKGFGADAERVAFLFELYQTDTTLLHAVARSARSIRTKAARHRPVRG